jgi:hypothetical protein
MDDRGMIEVTLGRCWDLLHQRHARRAASMSPDDVRLRDPAQIEGTRHRPSGTSA